jgi:hypothetical protein
MSFIRVLLSLVLLAFAPVDGFAQSCGFGLQIKYPDGEQGCLTDLPLSKVIEKTWGRQISDVAKSSGYYSIAAASNCSAVFIASANGIVSGSFGTRKEQTERMVLGQCPKNCDCTIVVANGQVLLPKPLALLLGENKPALAQNPESTTADNQKPLLAQAQGAKDIASKEKANSEVREKEKGLALAAEQEKQSALLAAQAAEKNQQLAKAEQAERQKDRELLLQLSAELLKLRQEAQALKNPPPNDPAPPANVASTAPPAAPAVYANRKALVIGNDGYKYVSALANAGEDARAIAENLTKVGYKVTLKLDQSEREMKTSLRNFKSQVEAGDEVAFFYAGHGVQLANTNYLLPVDVAGEGEEQIKDEAISLQRILDDMADKKAKLTLAMIDACRDNPFKGSGRSIGGGARGLAPTTAATGQMVVFSAGTGQQALDKLGPNDKDRNGLFTRVFVKQMQKSGITIDQLVRNVRNEVVATAKSIGHDQVPAIYDQVVGEFYFRK